MRRSIRRRNLALLVAAIAWLWAPTSSLNAQSLAEETATLSHEANLIRQDLSVLLPGVESALTQLLPVPEGWTIKAHDRELGRQIAHITGAVHLKWSIVGPEGRAEVDAGFLSIPESRERRKLEQYRDRPQPDGQAYEFIEREGLFIRASQRAAEGFLAPGLYFRISGRSDRLGPYTITDLLDLLLAKSPQAIVRSPVFVEYSALKGQLDRKIEAQSLIFEQVLPDKPGWAVLERTVASYTGKLEGIHVGPLAVTRYRLDNVTQEFSVLGSPISVDRYLRQYGLFGGGLLDSSTSHRIDGPLTLGPYRFEPRGDLVQGWSGDRESFILFENGIVLRLQIDGSGIDPRPEQMLDNMLNEIDLDVLRAFEPIFN